VVPVRGCAAHCGIDARCHHSHCARQPLDPRSCTNASGAGHLGRNDAREHHSGSTTGRPRRGSPRQDSHDRGRADGLRRRSCRSPVGRGRWPTLPGWLTRTRIRWSFTRHRTTQLASTSRPSLLSPRTFTRADLRLSSKWARASRYLRLSKLAGGPSLVRVVKASAARAKCASWKARQNTSIRSWVTKRKTNSGHSPLCFASDRFVARARS
jgi:hypothetical protein